MKVEDNVVTFDRGDAVLLADIIGAVALDRSYGDEVEFLKVLIAASMKGPEVD